MSLAELGPDLATAAEALQADTVELRRAIHHHPELGLHLPETQTKITEALTGLGLDITLGESTTSVVASLSRHQPGWIGSDASVAPGATHWTPSMLEHTSHVRSSVM